MKRFILLATSVFVFGINASGQNCSILIKNPYKIKAVHGVSSSTARVADYVEFVTMEDIYSDQSGPCKGGQVLIPKATPAYGVVTRRKHRHFPFVGGKLEVNLENMKAWDGTQIKVVISRHASLGKGSSKPCKNPTENCVAGRRNASVAPIVPAIAGSGSAVIAAVADDTAARVIAAAALFTLASQESIGNLLNGTDAEIAKDEIFDMHIIPPTTIPPLPKP
jgi:hypothetical protein